MSYREDNEQVVLTMSREDYERLLMMLGELTGHVLSGARSLWAPDVVMSLLNRLNEGNPNYTPYEVTPQ